MAPGRGRRVCRGTAHRRAPREPRPAPPASPLPPPSRTAVCHRRRVLDIEGLGGPSGHVCPSQGEGQTATTLARRLARPCREAWRDRTPRLQGIFLPAAHRPLDGRSGHWFTSAAAEVVFAAPAGRSDLLRHRVAGCWECGRCESELAAAWTASGARPDVGRGPSRYRHRAGDSRRALATPALSALKQLTA